MSKFVRDFRDFAVKGNAMDMAIGIVIGIAFGAIVTSLVSDIIMPPIGLALGKVDFSNMFAVLKEGKVAAPYVSLAEAKAAGAVTLNYGLFINVVISFIIVSFAVFLLARAINIARNQSAQKEAAPAAPTTKDCQFCYSKININAKRCPHCTSQL